MEIWMLQAEWERNYFRPSCYSVQAHWRALLAGGLRVTSVTEYRIIRGEGVHFPWIYFHEINVDPNHGEDLCKHKKPAWEAKTTLTNGNPFHSHSLTSAFLVSCLSYGSHLTSPPREPLISGAPSTAPFWTDVYHVSGLHVWILWPGKDDGALNSYLRSVQLSLHWRDLCLQQFSGPFPCQSRKTRPDRIPTLVASYIGS